MRPLLKSLVTILLFAASSLAEATEQTAPTPSGHWEGAIQLPGTSLAMQLDFKISDARIEGSIDIPAQSMRGFPLSDIEQTNEKLTFALAGIPGEPRFLATFTSDGNSLNGQLNQSGQSFNFSVSRAEKKQVEGATPSHGIPGNGIAGFWQGSLRPGAFELRLLFKLKTENNSTSGTLSSLDQDALDIPVSAVTFEKKSLTIEVEKIKGRFEGTLNEEGSEISGKWIQGANNFPLTIKRLESEPTLRRPQDPVKPYPYNEEQVTFENPTAGIQLAGTLTSPQGSGPHPAVILITGSGPQDRDEALMGHRPFLVLADRLTKSGIAVLRYDDRGYGASTGSFKNATTSDFTKDALAAFAFLKSRSDIDPKKIGLIGHSEGGIIAPQAAVANEDISFIVLLAGVGIPMDQLLARQSQDMIRVAGGSDKQAAMQAKLQARLFQTVKSTDKDTNLESQIRSDINEAIAELPTADQEALGLTPGQIENQIQMISSPWFRELLNLDPRTTLRDVTCPVLAVNGAKDIQVASTYNLSAIKSALVEGGNENVTTIEFPHLNHLFQTCETGATHEYGTIDETFNEDALLEISKWIQKTTGLNASPSQ